MVFNCIASAVKRGRCALQQMRAYATLQHWCAQARQIPCVELLATFLRFELCTSLPETIALRLKL